MKTKEQIEFFLKSIGEYATETDFDGISAFSKTKCKAKLRKPSSFSNSPDALTFSKFATWFDFGFGAGDVVQWDDSLGLVRNCTQSNVEICFIIDGNGSRIENKSLDVKDLTLADENASNRLYCALYKMGKEFLAPDFEIKDKFIPEPKNIISFTNLKTGQEGYAVIRCVTEDGEVFCFCIVVKGEDPRYNMNEHLGNVEDFIFRISSPSDYPRKAIDNALAKVGKTWNHALLRVEAPDMRVKKGEKYWFVNDKLQPIPATENERILCSKRYYAGNYFRNEEDAVNVSKKLAEVIRNYLAEPQK